MALRSRMNRTMGPWDWTDLFDDFLRRSYPDRAGLSGLTAGYPAINVYEGDEKAIVTAEVPGVDVDSLDVTAEGDMLTVSGERKTHEPGENERYLRRERGEGRFSRSVRLPFEVDTQNVSAECTNGVLKLELPKSEEAKPKKISVKTE